jgi:hypothetical protein
MMSSDKAALAVIMAQALSGQLFPLVDKRSKNNEPKNKYNLNSEQVELLKTMSPKDKKEIS